MGSDESQVRPPSGGVTKVQGDVSRVKSNGVTKGLDVSQVRSEGVTKGHDGNVAGMDWARSSR